MRQYLLTTLLGLTLSSSAFSLEYWTLKVKGINAVNDGQVSILIDQSYPANNPKPKDATWSCDDWIRISKTSSGSNVQDEALNRMMVLATTAMVTEARLRVAIYKLDGKCFSRQVFITK